MLIIYKAEINEDIVDGIGSVRRTINEALQQYGLEVGESNIETPYEVEGE